MKLIYSAALASALTVPSLAKASVVGLADVNLPNNVVDFIETGNNGSVFSYQAALSPTTFTIVTEEEETTPIFLLIEDFYAGSGGAGLSNEDPPGGTATGGTWLIDGGELQQASGTFSGDAGVSGIEFGPVSTTDLFFFIPPGMSSPEEGLSSNVLSLSNGDTVTISTPEPMQFDASVSLSPAGPGSYTATLMSFIESSEEGAGAGAGEVELSVIATTTVTFGQAPTPVPLPASALLLLCAVAALGVRRKA